MITKEMKELSMTQLKPQSFENEVVSVFTVRRSEKERGGFFGERSLNVVEK
jgi:hypothetical protein